MSAETKWTPGPWRYATTGNIGNCVEGQSGKKLFNGDTGYRTVAIVQDCIASDRYDHKNENARANINLIAAAPSLYDALNAVMREIVGDAFEGNTDIEKKAVKDAWAALKQARGETP